MNRYSVSIEFVFSFEDITCDADNINILEIDDEILKTRITEDVVGNHRRWQLHSTLEDTRSVSDHIKNILSAFPDKYKFSISHGVKVYLDIAVYWDIDMYANNTIRMEVNDLVALQAIISQFEITISTYPCKDR
jgi:hypothetical protein